MITGPQAIALDYHSDTAKFMVRKFTGEQNKNL